MDFPLLSCGVQRSIEVPGLRGVPAWAGDAIAGFGSDAMGEDTSPSSGTEAALAAAAALAEGDVTTVQGCTQLESSDAVDVSTSECSSPLCITMHELCHV